MQVLTLLPYEAMSRVFNPVCNCYDSWPVTKGLFAWCPGKAAWPRQRAQASDFGGLGSGSLPGRRAAWQGCIQTSPPASPRSPASERNQAFCWFNCSFYCLSSSWGKHGILVFSPVVPFKHLKHSTPVRFDLFWFDLRGWELVGNISLTL